MNGETKGGSLERILVLAGIVSVILDMVLATVLSALQEGYDPLAQFMSELGVPGSPFAEVISFWWIVEGILLVLYGIGFFRIVRGAGKIWWSGPVLVMTFGLFSGVGSGIFPCDVACAGMTLSGKMHEAANVIGTFAIVMAPFFTWYSLNRNIDWKRDGKAAIVFGIFALVGMAFFVISEDRNTALHQYKGLIQRGMFLVFYGWITVQGAFLLKRSRND